MQLQIQDFFFMAASQKLSDVLNNITVACTVDLLEISKVLHCSRYSSGTSADGAKVLYQKCSMPGAIERA
jgi:hypothetical protein